MEDDEGDSICSAEPPSSNSTGIDGYYFYVTEQLILQWFLLLAIVLGNGSVLLALAYSKNRKSRMNYFIMHLAIADLSVGLISVSTDLVWKYTIEWHAGNIACKVVKYLQALVTYSSTYVLVALSIDRFDAIKHPMKFSGSWRRAKFLIGAAWVLSAIFAQPVFFLYEEKCIQGRRQCWIHFSEQWMWQLFMSLVSLTVFFLPAIIISACYAVIVWTIWSKGSTVIVVTKRTAKGVQSEKIKLDHESESRRASSRGLIPRAKVKTVKMTFVIVSVFILCWSPYMIFDLLQVFNFIPESQVSIAVATLIQSLAPLNSAANPLIYCLFSTRICRSLKKLAPVSWLINHCCPQHSSRRHRYAGDLSSTMTSSLTQSRRSPGISLTTTNSVGTNKRHVTLL